MRLHTHFMPKAPPSVPSSPLMPRRLKHLIFLVVTVAGALSAAALALTTPWPAINGTAGIVFWIFVALVCAGSPVRMPGGTVVNVTNAPLVAAAVLGGPAAAALVSLLGPTEWRELRGLLSGSKNRTPWYGTLYNHASVVIPAVLGSALYGVMTGGEFAATPLQLGAVVVIGVFHFTVNNGLTALAIGFREGRPVASVFVSNVRQFGVSLAGLAPLSWLMGVVYVTAGPIGVLPFALPLYGTRSAYQKVVEIREMFTQTVKSLASAVDAKDPFTAGHSVRVQQIAKDLGRELNCSESEMEALEWGGLLHDIGKIGIPDAILLKQGALTRQERMVMNAHPVKGEEIIRPVAKLAPELPIIRHHHEWYNGSGYPDHLVGEEIPWLARIMHIADAFEAMTAARPYRMTPLTQAQGLNELRRFTGVQFDPVVVAAFERLIARRPEWSLPDEAPPLPTRKLRRLGEPGTLSIEPQPA
ncbi:HD-GYP domain-containing protein [soil metagenome]